MFVWDVPWSVVTSGCSDFVHSETDISSSFHPLGMTLAVAEALGPNKLNQQIKVLCT